MKQECTFFNLYYLIPYIQYLMHSWVLHEQTTIKREKNMVKLVEVRYYLK